MRSKYIPFWNMVMIHTDTVWDTRYLIKLICMV